MNFDAAIKAHVQWKGRLAGYSNNPDGSINPDELGEDNRCELGKWIYGEAKRHVNLPEMIALKAAHADFHRAASAVVRKIDSGGQRDQDALTGFKSEFGMMTQRVADLLNALATKIS